MTEQGHSVKNIAFIGTGIMGRPMAAHLIEAGYKLAVYNRTASKTQPLVDAGARLAASPADAAKGADVVITMLGYPSDVEEVYLGDNGLIRAAEKGAYLIDMTTSSPQLARDIYEAAEVEDKHAFDAPVTGGDTGAINATLTIFCGASDATVAPVMDVLKAMGPLVLTFGEAGKGQMAKLANQVALAGCMLGFAEGMAFAKQGGLDLEKTLGALTTGMASSTALKTFGPKILAGDYKPGFQVRHFIKDLKLALDVAEEEQLTLPGVEAATQLYQLISDIGGDRMGTQALSLAYDDEQTCADAGLDWSKLDDNPDYQQDSCDCGHDHDHASEEHTH